MASLDGKWVGGTLLVALASLMALTSCGGLTAAEVHNNAGVALHEDGHYERAIADYDEALRSDPELALAYYNRGLAYARLQEFERAVESYDESIRLAPQFAEAFRGRAFAYDALGQRARAAEDNRAATRLSRLAGVVRDDSNRADEYLRTTLDFLSSYGPRVLAAVGTGLIGAAVLVGSIRLRRWLDRPMLRPNARLDYLHDLKGPDSVLKLFLEARNPHSSPLIIQSLGVELGSGANPLLVVIPQGGYVFPHEVKKGESITEWTDIRNVVDKIENEGGSPSDLKWVWFRTSTGERHRARLNRSVLRGLSNFRAPATDHTG